MRAMSEKVFCTVVGAFTSFMNLSKYGYRVGAILTRISNSPDVDNPRIHTHYTCTTYWHSYFTHTHTHTRFTYVSCYISTYLPTYLHAPKFLC